MSRRRNQAGIPLYLGIAAGLGVAWLVIKNMGSGSSQTTAQLNAELEADPYASDAPGTVLPGGSVVLQ